ncbi:amino acid permease [Lacticaseibacillus daqingensis]|uniref:amino acid permease n=1 Tax=Lacticaseibacillus daqingensis TaxID=2486014 RepID=UPI000F777607|nr:amino acid permease [Lacticaseibacillus daqingensis]
MATQTDKQLARNLKGRHIQLMAIGGTIGTGLFLGAGKAIHAAGPAIILAYLLCGLMCFFLMRALGELLMSDLTQHSFLDFVGRYLGPRAAAVTGWTYWLCWVALAMAEVTAVGVYVRFWWPNLPQWLPGLVILLVLWAVNLISVGLFGEAEFWFALIKVVAILALIALGAVLLIGRVHTAAGTATLTNLWTHGGFFPRGVGGFIMAFQMVVFSFTGIELVGLTASETRDPAKTIPSAINQLPVRIILFYVGALVVIMSLSPWTAVSADRSPFVQVFQTLGIPGGADIINFVVLTAAASACNSGLYSTGRLLFSMAITSRDPHLHRLAKLSKRQVPARAITASTAVIAVAVGLNYFLPAAVFTLVASVATISFLFVWVMIVLAHLAFKKTRPRRPTFAAPLYPLGDWFVLAFLAMIVVIMMLARDTAIATLVAGAVIVGLAVWQGRTGVKHTKN